MKVILENQEYKNIERGIEDAFYSFNELHNNYNHKYTDDVDRIFEWLETQPHWLVAGKLKEIFAAINQIKANFE